MIFRDLVEGIRFECFGLVVEAGASKEYKRAREKEQHIKHNVPRSWDHDHLRARDKRRERGLPSRNLEKKLNQTDEKGPSRRTAQREKGRMSMIKDKVKRHDHDAAMGKPNVARFQRLGRDVQVSGHHRTAYRRALAKRVSKKDPLEVKRRALGRADYVAGRGRKGPASFRGLVSPKERAKSAKHHIKKHIAALRKSKDSGK